MQEYAVGFNSLKQERENIDLSLQGQIPAWLNGILVRNGPACFEAGNQPLQHWFDGFAMLHRFCFSNGAVNYSNKFIASQAYLQAMQKKKLVFKEFATNPPQSFLKRLMNIFSPSLTDNTSVNMARFDRRYFAMTETVKQILFDPITLETKGYCHYDDEIAGQVSTAHPHFDYNEQALYNFNVEIGSKCYYHVYRLLAGKSKRELVCSIQVDKPAYLHSFAMTKRYLIIVEPPLLLNKISLLLSKKSFIENYDWQPQRGSRFLIIDKQKNCLVTEIASDPFFLFHHVNAYEFNDKELIIDLPLFNDSSIIQALYLEQVKKDNLPLPQGVRFHVDLSRRQVRRENLCDIPLEFPRLNYHRFNSVPYRYFYAVGVQPPATFLQELLKVDVQTGLTKKWREQHCYPGEPVFVAHPEATKEDEGIILVVVLNVKLNNSFLLALDADSFQELARATIPHLIPFGFHGQFWNVDQQ